MREADMRHQSIAEERRRAAPRAIEELIGDDELERAVLLLERTHGAQRNDALYAQHPEAPDVGAEVQLRRRGAMTSPVPREKRDLLARERAHHVRVRWVAPRRPDQVFFLRFKARHRVQPAAANYSDLRVHCFS